MYQLKQTVRLRYGGAALLALFLIVPLAAQSSDEASLRRLQNAAQAIAANKLTDAEAMLTTVLSDRPRDADALNLLGVVRAQQQRPMEAERLFRKALTISSSHLGAHLNLSELYLTTGRPRLALPVLLAGYRLSPRHIGINLKLGELYGNIGNHQRALEHLRSILPAEAGPTVFPLLLRSLIKLNRMDEARQLAGEFLASGTNDAGIQLRFATLLVNGGLTREADDLLRSPQWQAGNSFPVLYALGVSSANARSHEKAEEYLSEALRQKPEDIATLRALARVARQSGNLEKSMAHLVTAKRLAPEDPSVLYDFGITALQMDLLLDALPALEQLYRKEPREAAFVYAMAAARLRNGELMEAERLLRIYVKLRPQDAAGFYLLGATLRRLSHYVAARNALEHSLKLQPDVDAQYVLAMTLYEEGKRAAAIELLKQVVQFNPNHAAGQAALGLAYREQGSYKEAQLALEQAVKLNPYDLRAHYQLGLVYTKVGNAEAARKMFERADDLRGQQRNQESVILKLIEPPPN
jgi:tetratricopeptide (TPR) repeat protein